MLNWFLLIGKPLVMTLDKAVKNAPYLFHY